MSRCWAAELVDDARFAVNELRVRHRDVLDALIEDAFATRRLPDVIAALERGDVPWADVNDTAGLIAHRQLEARDRWVDVDARGGRFRALRPPFNIAGWAPPPGDLPALGDHTDAVLAETGGARREPGDV